MLLGLKITDKRSINFSVLTGIGMARSLLCFISRFSFCFTWFYRSYLEEKSRMYTFDKMFVTQIPRMGGTLRGVQMLRSALPEKLK